MNGEVVLSFNSRNNTTIITAPHEQGSELPSMAGNHSSMIPLELETIQQPAAASDSNDSSDDHLKRTMKAAVPIALFMAATSAGLILNAAEPLRFFFLVAPYNTLLNLSLFISVSLAIYSIMNNINSTGRNHTSSSTSISADTEIVWVLRMLMLLGLIAIFLAFVLRGLMVQAYSSLVPAWLLFFAIVGLIFLILWMVWKKNNNNIRTVITLEVSA